MATILSTLDHLQSLIRSQAYRDDYEAHAAFLSEWEFEELPPGSMVNLGVLDASALNRPRLAAQHPEAFEVGENFLRRWPMLVHPIPPDKAIENPDYFLPFLRSPVEIERSVFPGKTTRLSMLADRMVLESDLRDGRFLVARIDLSRPKAEILEALGREIDAYRGAGWNLPPANARTSTPKKSTLDLSSRKWEAFDAYTRAGRDVQETAAILFPGEYDKRKAKREAKAEAEAFLSKKGGRRGGSGRDFATYERLLAARATPATIKRREAIEREIRRIVKDCEAATEAIKPG